MLLERTSLGTQAILFDAVGTILHPNPSPARVYQSVARQFDLELELDLLRTRFIEAFVAQENHDARNGYRVDEQREFLRWQTIVKDCLLELDHSEAAFELLWHHFANPSAWKVDEGFLQTLNKLSQQGLILGVASNFDSRLRKIIAAESSLDCFGSNVFISSELGYKKPSGHFYHLILDRIKLDAESILFIGDDLSNDYFGPQSVGMQSLLFDPDAKHPNIQNRIESWGQLPSHLS
jgi:putative hydrolase of the HAD superfamily